MFLLNQNMLNLHYHVMKNLQYKMFLLNDLEIAEEQYNDPNLQYKMFLLNVREYAIFNEYGTIYNTKCSY